MEYQIEEQRLLRTSWMTTTPVDPIVDSSFNEFWMDWFDNPNTDCPLPFTLCGTPFQRTVWSQLLQIQLGQTKAYKDIALAIGSPNAQQAVGQACKANPIALLIPCHRVLGKNDRLTGYVGTTLIPIKAQLLEWERGFTSMQ